TLGGRSTDDVRVEGQLEGEAAAGGQALVRPVEAQPQRLDLGRSAALLKRGIADADQELLRIVGVIGVRGGDDLGGAVGVTWGGDDGDRRVERQHVGCWQVRGGVGRRGGPGGGDRLGGRQGVFQPLGGRVRRAAAAGAGDDAIVLDLDGRV